MRARSWVRYGPTTEVFAGADEARISRLVARDADGGDRRYGGGATGRVPVPAA